MSPRSEEYLVLARERLGAAQATLDGGYTSATVSLAYYAMLYAARGALSEEDSYAKTHSGTWLLFVETFVDTGRLDPELAAAARKAQQRREDADYRAKVETPDEARQLLDAAERFVAAIEALIG